MRIHEADIRLVHRRLAMLGTHHQGQIWTETLWGNIKWESTLGINTESEGCGIIMVGGQGRRNIASALRRSGFPLMKAAGFIRTISTTRVSIGKPFCIVVAMDHRVSPGLTL